MGTLKLDSQPHLLGHYSNIHWNINDPVVRKSLMNALPQRQNTNPFFIRNNPHPSRVRHIKGLLDHPVCTVMDSGYRDGQVRIHNDVLASSIRQNVDRRKHESFVPGIGLVTVQPTWVEQLQTLTSKLNDTNTNAVTGQQEVKQTRPSTRSSTRQSSSRSNNSRMLEKREMEDAFVRKTCSRQANIKFEDAFARKSFSREGQGKENNVEGKKWHLPGNIVLEENEVNVAHLLSQILKTDSLDVIRHWLMEAPDQEKEVVLEMLRAASNSNLEFREVMNKLTKNSKHEDLEDIRSEYEKMRDMKDIKSSSKVSTPRGLSRGKKDCYFLDAIKENLEADMNVNRLSARSQSRSKEILLPNIRRDDQDIEVLRSQLASRSSINVFPAKTSRCSAR